MSFDLNFCLTYILAVDLAYVLMFDLACYLAFFLENYLAHMFTFSLVIVWYSFSAYSSGFGPKIVELAISGNPRPFGCQLRGMGKALRRLVFLSALCLAVYSRTCLPEAWTVHQPACLVVGVNAHNNWTVVPTHVVLNSYVGRWKAMTCISHVEMCMWGKLIWTLTSPPP